MPPKDTNTETLKRLSEEARPNEPPVPKDNHIPDSETSSKDVTVFETVDVEALADRCLSLLKACESGDHSASCAVSFNDHNQIFIGIAGTPGSGKSFIANEIAKVIAKRNPNGEADTPECVVVGMDGYHLTRKELKERAENGYEFKTDQEDDDGNPIKTTMTYDQLLARRGAAFTYDPQKFIQDLKRIKEDGHGSLPEYDRDQHDPVPDRVQVRPENKIILVEGLYLLCLHDPEWAPLGELWDDTWFVEVSLDETKRRLVKRHLKYWNEEKTKQWGGSDEKAAARKAESNDLKNAVCIQKFSRNNAKLIVHNEKIPEDDNNNADVEAA